VAVAIRLQLDVVIDVVFDAESDAAWHGAS
jgi:hypothetical protein